MARATVALKPGETQETVQRTRIITPESEIPWWTSIAAFKDAEERPAFWDFIESLSENDWMKVNMRVWRFDANAKNQLGAFITEIGSGPMNPKLFRDEVGGGKFKVYVRYGSILVYNETVENAGPEKTFTPEVHAVAAAAASDGVNAQLINMMDSLMRRVEERFNAQQSSPLLQNAAADALAIQRQGFENSLAVLRETIKGTTASGDHGNPMSEVTKLLLPAIVAMLTKALEPKNTLAEMMEGLKMIKELSATAGIAAPSSDVGTEFVRQIPTIMQGIGKVMGDYRAAAEAGAAARGVRTINVNPAPAAPPSGGLPAGAPPAPPAAAPAHISQETYQQVGFQIHAGTVVTILNDASKTVEERAEQALLYLEAGAPKMVEQILQMGDTQAVLNVLATIPALEAVAKHPDGKQFVEIFLREAREPAAA